MTYDRREGAAKHRGPRVPPGVVAYRRAGNSALRISRMTQKNSPSPRWRRHPGALSRAFATRGDFVVAGSSRIPFKARPSQGLSLLGHPPSVFTVRCLPTCALAPSATTPALSIEAFTSRVVFGLARSSARLALKWNLNLGQRDLWTP